MDFETLWNSSIRFRSASRELQPLLHEVHRHIDEADAKALRRSLERLLVFLASPRGRVDANLATIHYFLSACDAAWRTLPAPLTAILDDMSGTLHESVYAPDIARTFEATPEQLLIRLRAVK